MSSRVPLAWSRPPQDITYLVLPPSFDCDSALLLSAHSALGQDRTMPSRRFTRTPCPAQQIARKYELCIHIYLGNGLTLKVRFLHCGRRPVKWVE